MLDLFKAVDFGCLFRLDVPCDFITTNRRKKETPNVNPAPPFLPRLIGKPLNFFQGNPVNIIFAKRDKFIQPSYIEVYLLF
jgi:hypothetical protein